MSSNYNEDKALEQAMALSLITAKEDDQRRLRKYPSQGPEVSDSLIHPVVPKRPLSKPGDIERTSTTDKSIQRPRPQSNRTADISVRGSSITPPPLPPRPDPQRVETAKQHAQHANNMYSRPSQTTDIRPIAPLMTGSPPSHHDDPPLILLSPAPSSTTQTDLDIFDPLKSNTISTSSRYVAHSAQQPAAIGLHGGSDQRQSIQPWSVHQPQNRAGFIMTDDLLKWNPSPHSAGVFEYSSPFFSPANAIDHLAIPDRGFTRVNSESHLDTMSANIGNMRSHHWSGSPFENLDLGFPDSGVMKRSLSNTEAFLKEDNDDLMSFPIDINDYLSIESFDPLLTDSRSKLLTDTLLSAKGLESPSVRVETAAGGQLHRSISRPMAGLQDPFSVPDLMLELEGKRRKHAMEQEKRKQQLEAAQEQSSNNRVNKQQDQPAVQEQQPKDKQKRASKKEKQSAYEGLREYKHTSEDEFKAFCDFVVNIKRKYSYTDDRNVGYMASPLQQSRTVEPTMTVKVIIQSELYKEPVIFAPALEVTVNDIIVDALSRNSFTNIEVKNYLLKVLGKAEYLVSSARLGDHEHIQDCLKLDKEIILLLVDITKMEKPWRRTAEDDVEAILVPKQQELGDPSTRITRDKLNILMETFYKECEKLRDAAIQSSEGAARTRVPSNGVLQAVKALCVTLCNVQTILVIQALQQVNSLVSALNTNGMSSESARISELYSLLDDLHTALEELTRAVKMQVNLFCKTFHCDFMFTSSMDDKKPVRGTHLLSDTLLVHISTAHRIPAKWRETYEQFRVICGVYYGGFKLCEDIFLQSSSQYSKELEDSIIWDEWVNFETLPLSHLPRETRLLFTLIGVRVVTNASNNASTKVNSTLGWVALQMFDHKYSLVQGYQLLGLWQHENPNPTGTTQSAIDVGRNVLLQVTLPDFPYDYVFEEVTNIEILTRQPFNQLSSNEQEQLNEMCYQGVFCKLYGHAQQFLWSKRFHLLEKPDALARVLQAAPSWDWFTLAHMYSLLSGWEPGTPVQCLELLLPHFPDMMVRAKAVESLKNMSSENFLELLPQFVQALKFESYHTSALAGLLLERAMMDNRIAHHLYWLMKEAAQDPQHRRRYQLLFGGLLSVIGKGYRKEFGKQDEMVTHISAVAEKVKAAKDKQGTVKCELNNMWDFFGHETVHLPTDPGFKVKGLLVDSCSYFPSNALPLKLVFSNDDPGAEPVFIMFKAGDDLRQDMLTMQMIRIMDKLWIREGLDLKMITFNCQSTGARRIIKGQPAVAKMGFVEIITESETLRKIQVTHGKGVVGSFKASTIHDWLKIHNPTELEYRKAVKNFTESCAGYCVATYVLGIGDRHNDNIMVKHSGHIFHIDFGKFLGDVQTFGSFKRDRTPFVLTPDMAYVINDGEQASDRFQNFIDLCCQAFNLLRKHSSLFVSLFVMMAFSGISGVSEASAKYIQNSLLPDHSDAEATVMFTRMIEESLKSTFTQVNFFIHNLAQMKFTDHKEGALLSFIPKRYSMQTDGKITSVEVFGYQKRYSPEKYYIFILKVARIKQKVPSFVFRRYSEFQELHYRLKCTFPLSKLPPLKNRVILGRTHVQTVAEERKQEIEQFLYNVFHDDKALSEHDLIYTFFHPMLRDEQDIDKTSMLKLKEPNVPSYVPRGKIEGQIKFSVMHKNDELTIMIMHVKNLQGQAGDPPDPYVKIYLLPDPFKATKKKTKIARNSFHPTFNEMLSYRMSYEDARRRTLSVSVWTYDRLKENEFLGAVKIKLSDLRLAEETAAWFPLQDINHMTVM